MGRKLKELIICDEDCFHCIYPDCIGTPREEVEQELRNREYRQRYYKRKKEEKKRKEERA